MNETINADLGAPAIQPQGQDAPPVQAPHRNPATAILRWLLGSIPTAIVVVALCGVAYWGHHSDWTIPKFSTLAGNAVAAKDDWCEAHGVPESQCVECQADLLPKAKDYGWCKKHGVSNCPLEHPDVAQVRTIPKITEEDLERAQRTLVFAERTENGEKCKLYQRRIQFASDQVVEKLGVDIMTVWRAPMTEGAAANGVITYDQTRVARLSSRAPGIVWYVTKKVGEPVKRGEVLAVVDAAEVGKAKAEFVNAVVQIGLKTKIVEDLRTAAGAVPARQINEAEAMLSEAQVRLLLAQQTLANLGLPIRVDEVKNLSPEEIARRIRFLGLPETISSLLNPTTATANLIPMVSPLDGVVTACEVVSGEVVDTAKVLFIAADTSRMWLTLDVRLEDARQLAMGQTVRFRPDGSKVEAAGKVDWISTAVDEKTRTLKVRSELENADGRLRAFTFGPATIVLREEKDAIVVPNEAVHWEGDCNVVFVRDRNYLEKDAPKVFHVRTVRVGAKDAQNTEIIAGVLPGEIVATKNSGSLRSELLKNDIGEG